MNGFALAKRLTLGAIIAGSLAFEPLDNCKLCHQVAPVSAGHVAVTGASWPVCATCHGLDPATVEANTIIVGLHANHVSKLGFDCGVCHTISGAEDQAGARQRLGLMLDKDATE